jgi:hypothetical protein
MSLRKIVVMCAVVGFASLAVMQTAHAQKRRAGNTAMGAAAGLVVGGPIGAIAGGTIGYVAGEDIARGMGIKRRHHHRYWVDRRGRRHYYR